ncbi:zf-CCHC domain-containing protein [Tanacetum coccineum]
MLRETFGTERDEQQEWRNLMLGNTAQDFKVGNLGRPNHGELGYIDTKMPKHVNKKGRQRQSKVGIVKNLLTDKYCPRSEIKKLEIEIWNLKVKGTDVVKKYVEGLPDMIQGSVMVSKPKTMQEAIKISNDLMDQKVRAYAERQAENKRKLDNNNQAQKQPPKKQNVARAYYAGPSEKKEYVGLYRCATSASFTTMACALQVKDNKIDLLVQQYEQFTILEEESIDSGFARFNTIITSLKALDEGFSSKNYVRKFLRALHPKWRVKVTAIEESKDLSSLALNELIGNLKVHEVVMEKDFEIYRGKKEMVKSISLKAKKEPSDNETSTSESDDEEYAMAKSFRQRDEKKGKSDEKCFRCGDPNHLIGNCPKPPRNKDQKAFIGGSWSDSENDAEDKTKDETCLMAQ